MLTKNLDRGTGFAVARYALELSCFAVDCELRTLCGLKRGYNPTIYQPFSETKHKANEGSPQLSLRLHCKIKIKVSN